MKNRTVLGEASPAIGSSIMVWQLFRTPETRKNANITANQENTWMGYGQKGYRFLDLSLV